MRMTLRGAMMRLVGLESWIVMWGNPGILDSNVRKWGERKLKQQLSSVQSLLSRLGKEILLENRTPANRRAFVELFFVWNTPCCIMYLYCTYFHPPTPSLDLSPKSKCPFTFLVLVEHGYNVQCARAISYTQVSYKLNMLSFNMKQCCANHGCYGLTEKLLIMFLI